MTDFTTRHGYDRESPARVVAERDSPRLRALIWVFLSKDGKLPKVGYTALCAAVGELPDSDVWSENASTEASMKLIEDLPWNEVYEVLERIYLDARHGSGSDLQSSAFTRLRIEADVNAALERSGLAYEMRAGRFELFDPEATELGIRGREREALGLLNDEFGAVRAQYQKALDKLQQMPSDFEGAVADALNSLEAVAVIVTGRSGATLGDAAKRLFPGGEGYHQPLREAIGKLYGYSSAVPGVRHGRYAEPIIAYAETTMVVRIVGAMIVFLITDYRS